MPWFRFWYNGGNRGGTAETYEFLHGKNLEDEDVQEHVDRWVGRIRSHEPWWYRSGFERIKCPPRPWLRTKAKSHLRQADYYEKMGIIMLRLANR